MVDALTGELIEYRHEEALGLARPGAAGHQHRLGRRLAQQPPAAQLVVVGVPVAAEAVVGTVLGRAVHRPDEPRRERAGLGEIHHRLARKAPAERRLEDRIGKQGTVAARRRLEGAGQEAPKLGRPHGQLAGQRARGTLREIANDIGERERMFSHGSARRGRHRRSGRERRRTRRRTTPEHANEAASSRGPAGGTRERPTPPRTQRRTGHR